jgi:hypothetical protein
MPVHSPFSRFHALKSRQQLAQTDVEAIGALKIIVQSAHIDGPNGWWRRPNPFITIRVNETQVKTDTQAATYVLPQNPGAVV